MLDELFDTFDNTDISEDTPDIDSSINDVPDIPEMDTPVLENDTFAYTESFANTNDFFSLQSTVNIEDYVNTNSISENAGFSLGGLQNSELTIDNNDVALRNPEIEIDNDILAVDNTPLSVDNTDLSIDNEIDDSRIDNSQISFGGRYACTCGCMHYRDDGHGLCKCGHSWDNHNFWS
jgi:hypothetical protein